MTTADIITPMKPTPEVAPAASMSYDRVTIAIHWTVAVMVLFQWFGAQAIDWFPKGPARVDARSVHITAGMILVVVILFRIYWRSTAGRRLVAPGSPRAALAAVLVHKALYLIVLLTLGLGIYNTWMRGDSLFELVKIPAFGDYDAATRHLLANDIVRWHKIAANTILAIAGAHACAALAHYFIFKDGVLQRMVPAASPRE
ncbi:MAG: cytochrome b/b6 domain-containing protein [Pseudomonadota bacterium]|nr:cytochrome b/b6 domain-containing protein [Pseudomonadota bacterium]